tara:strand:+ start:31 stop:441 length:411 start_codon:yes stop_codon:yes gene_type:complete
MIIKDPLRTLLKKINSYVDRLKMDSIALWFATKHPKTPILIQAIIWFAVAYALSPIDLIPDFVPILGLLDDLILLAVSVTFAVNLISEDIMSRCRALAQQWIEKQKKHPTVVYGALIVIGIWLFLIFFVFKFYFKI